jgi:hypothetical protein
VREKGREGEKMENVFNIDCDESRHTSDPSDRYMVIGAVESPRSKKRQIVKDIHMLRRKHCTQGEFGWKRLSPNKRDFYFAILDYFVNSDVLAFRCIVVDKHNFTIDDEELGFYKLYYQMLFHWLVYYNEYYIYLDHKTNAQQDRLYALRKCLLRAHVIKALEPANSKELEIMQLTDLLIGAVGYAWNLRNESQVKSDFCNTLATRLGLSRLDVSTWKSERKFNVFFFGGRHE